ncbi:hypothetical protein GGI42DRAFT_205819 [Trichoderma sp. SZMC 28013]
MSTFELSPYEYTGSTWYWYLCTIACQTFFRCRRPLPTPSLSLPIFPGAAAGQSMQKPCKTQHRPDHKLAQAAAREASQHETRLERRFGGDKGVARDTRGADWLRQSVYAPGSCPMSCFTSSRRIMAEPDPSCNHARAWVPSVARQLGMRRR